MARECLALDPAPPSCALARRWLADRLEGYPQDIVDTVVLLASELVANGILHASTAMEMSLEHDAAQIRVEVADGSEAMPVRRGYGEMASTGRGLTLVEGLATNWGVQPATPGKVVFFEVRVADPSPPDLVKVVMMGLPLAAIRRAGEQYGALGREFRLIIEADPQQEIPARLFALAEELHGRLSPLVDPSNNELWRAMDSGDEIADVEYWLPSDIGPAIAAYDGLLDEADAYCRSGALLTLAATAETVAVRKWFLAEVAGQLAGRSPTPWVQPD
jgi:anti-sigma regulatory factor (Ser/Thr protein kinase)